LTDRVQGKEGINLDGLDKCDRDWLVGL